MNPDLSPEDLSPINKPVQPPAPKPPVAPSVLAPEPVPPTPAPTTPPAPPASPAPAREPSIPFVSKVESPVPPPKPKISTIRTFKGDVTSGISTNNVTLTSIALANQAKRKNDATLVDGSKPRRNMAPAIGIAIGILLIGVGVFAFITFKPSAKPEQTQIVVVPASLVFAESTKVIDTRDISSVEALKAAIAREASASSNGSGKVLALAFTTGEEQATRIIGAEEFFAVVAPSMPQNLLRALEDDFFFGIYAHEKSEPFIMFENDSYENSFAGMLAWEDKLALDILPLFGRKGELSNTRVSNWKDKVIRNIDARVETDEAGITKLVYAFINRKTLVIAGSEVGFIEALTRFHTPRPVTR